MEDSDSIKHNSIVRVEDVHGEVHEGRVEFFDRSSSRLILRNVYNFKKKHHTSGQIQLFFSDIENYKVIDQFSYECENQLKKENIESSSRTLSFNSLKVTDESNDVHKKTSSVRYNELSSYSQSTDRPLIHSSDGFESISNSGKNETKNKEFDRTHISVLGNKALINESNNVHCERNIDLSSYNHIVLTDFTSCAIIIKKKLSECKTLYIRLFGNKTKNYEKISLLCLHIDDFTYIFDMISIDADEEGGQQKIMQLLKPFISNPEITKIFFNSLEQKLIHKFNIELNSVFDVKESCKKIYPRLSKDELDFENLVYHLLPDVEDDRAKLDELNTDWNARPLNRSYKYFVIRKTACLFNFHVFLKEKIFEKWCLDTAIRFNTGEYKNENEYSFASDSDSEYKSLITNDTMRYNSFSETMLHSTKNFDASTSLSDISSYSSKLHSLVMKNNLKKEKENQSILNASSNKSSTSTRNALPAGMGSRYKHSR